MKRLHAGWKVCIVLFAALAGWVRCSVPVWAGEDDDWRVIQRAFGDGLYEVTASQAESFAAQHPRSVHSPAAAILWGRSLIELDRAKDAAKILHRISEAHATVESGGESLYWLGRAYLKMGDPTLALAQHQKLYQDYPSSPRALEARLEAARILEKSGDLVSARAIYEELILTAEGNAIGQDAMLDFGRMEFEAGNYVEAENILRTFGDRFPLHRDAAEAGYIRAESLFQLKSYPEALEIFVKLAASDKQSTQKVLVAHGLGWTYFRLERFAESLKVFEEAGEDDLNPLADSFAFGRARSLQSLNRLQEALTAYEDLERKFPRSELVDDALFWSGEARYDLEDFSGAAEVWKKLVWDYPKSDLRSRGQYQLAWAYFKLRQNDEAVKYLEVIIETTEDPALRAGALCRLADDRLERGRVNEAMELYDQVLEDESASIYADYAQYQLATVFLKSGNWDAAALGFQALIERYPTSAYQDDARYGLGFAHIKKNDFAAAETVFDEMIARHPESVLKERAYFQLGLASLNAGHAQKALEIFGRIRGDGASDALTRSARYYEGLALLKLGRDEEAINALLALCESDPQSGLAADTWAVLADTFFQKQRFEEAVGSVRALIERFPGKPQTIEKRAILAESLVRLGRTDQARAVWKESVLSRIQTPEASDDLRRYADLEFSSGNPGEAESFLMTLTATDKAHPAVRALALKKLAEIHEARADVDKSLFYFKESLAGLTAADAADVHLRVGTILAKQGKSDEAVGEYLKVVYGYPEVGGAVASARRLAAAVLTAQGKTDEARKLLAGVS